MKKWRLGLVASAVILLGAPAQATMIGVRGGDASPPLSESLNIPFVVLHNGDGRASLPFENDLGVIFSITFESDLDLDSIMPVLETSVLRRIDFGPIGSHLFTLFDERQVIDQPGLIIDFVGLGDPVFLIIRSVRTVPEPGVLVLMGAGLGILGFQARRRVRS